ncbi:MAG: LysM peptidoglycan-binding domain-containing protein [Desulfobacteraceae bacterium]|nr:LysM peptidoglycan-binding domain-containing protein [Desulfobacteraceae bacterium]
MTTWQKAWGTLICIAICTAWFCPLPSLAMKQSVKTSFKRYAVYPYMDRKVLCEPYRVAKDDWLYKIFRQKGEISESDFPLFLAIFKTLNPGVSNIDNINPGQEILIPLKTVLQEDFNETVPGVVDVPIIEFSSLPEMLTTHLKQYRVQKGETVSELVDPAFLDRYGNLTEQGVRAFSLANPDVKNVNLIYEGSVLNLPSPSLISQTWFSSLFRSKPDSPANTDPEPSPPPVLDKAEVQAGLERFAAMKQGKLIQSGKYYFPGKDGRDMVLDLESTPLIVIKDGSRLVMVRQNSRSPRLEAAMGAYWKNLTFIEMETALQTLATPTGPAHNPGKPKPGASAPGRISQDHPTAFRELLDHTGIAYISDTVISLNLGGIELDVKVEKIPRQGRADLIVELGDVYGAALDRIREQGYEILTLSPREKTRDMAMKLFPHLGIKVVEDPAFISPGEKRTVTIPGIYITGAPRKQDILVAEQRLDRVTIDFLKQKQIKVLYTIPPDQGA